MLNEKENNAIKEEYEERTGRFYSTLRNLTCISTAFTDANLNFDIQLDPEGLGVRLHKATERLLQIANRIIVNQEHNKASIIKSEVDLHPKTGFNNIIEVLDNSYERVNIAIGSLKKSKKVRLDDENIGIEENSILDNNDGVQDSLKSSNLANNFTRPQAKFSENLNTGQFAQFVSLVYRLGIKHHAVKPLTDSELELCKGKQCVEIDYNLATELPNPYEFEINHLNYPEHMFQLSEPHVPKSMSKSPLKLIATMEELEKLIKELEKQEVIAIDLEHHDYRSYYGFVCLMQISSKNCDYIIDTLELRNELFELNRVFSNPNIVKVFHGANSDIIWLQRDFGLYIVNLFDTYHASHALKMDKHSLSFLLKKYVNFDANKQYQSADWRTRPLPPAMIDYARADTHFLLYIYEIMKNELIKNSDPISLNLVYYTLGKSNEVALQRFLTYPYDLENGRNPGGWAKLLDRWNVSVKFGQVEAFKQIHAWRDHLAREQDESPAYILPNHMLYNLAYKLPKDSAEVLACTNPVPPSIKIHASDLAILITAAGNAIKSLPSSFVPSKNKEYQQTSLKKLIEEEIDINTLAKVDIPISKNLKGKNKIKDLLPKIELNNGLQKGSELFGNAFFADNNKYSELDEQISELEIALVDQIKVNLSFNLLPPSVTIQAQIEDVEKESSLPMKGTEAPELHKYNPEVKEKIDKKSQVKVLSGKSKFGKKDHTISEVFQATSKEQAIVIPDSPIAPENSNPKIGYDYSKTFEDYEELINSTANNGNKKVKKSEVQNNEESKSKSESKKNDKPVIRGARKSNRTQAGNKSHTYKR